VAVPLLLLLLLLLLEAIQAQAIRTSTPFRPDP